MVDMVAIHKKINRLIADFYRYLIVLHRPGCEISMARFMSSPRSGLRAVMLGLVALINLATLNAALSTSANANQDASRVMVFGDSLVAGHGLAQGEAFPDILRAALIAAGHNVEIINAGVSGDTTAGGLARLEWSFAENPDALIIVLGGNDLLRGLDPAATGNNLAAIIDHSLGKDVPVLLAGMQAPRNLGRAYAAEFDAIFAELGERDDVVFYPFFLDGVALVPSMNQPDGIHPNEAGVAEITRRILPSVETLLGQCCQKTLN